MKPFTEYEFQISSKLHPNKSIWSDWSEALRIQTPEEGMFRKKKERKKERWGLGKKGGKEENTMISLVWNL